MGLSFTIINQNDWTPYSVNGEPAERKLLENRGCWSLSTVSHVTHLDAAASVLTAGIRGRTFTEDSRIADPQISVAWVSPAAGRDGSHYGNVAFDLDWSALSKRYQAYWIGAKRYENPGKTEPFDVPVIFLTHREYPQLKAYEREARTGPWWHDAASGEHHWNADCWLEFMVDLPDGPLPPSSISRVSFADHHKAICARTRKTGDPCADLGLSASRAEAAFLAGSIIGAIRVPHALYSPAPADTGALLNLDNALRQLHTALFSRQRWRGNQRRSSEGSREHALQVLSEFWAERSAYPATLSEFASYQDAWASLEEVIVTTLRHVGWRSSVWEDMELEG